MRRRDLLTSLNGDAGHGFALLGILALLWALAAGGPAWTQALCYQREAIGQGQIWRLVSAHWVHLGVRHLLLDSAGLALLWALYARELRPAAWLAVLLAATAAIDAGLWWGEPQLQWYVGISGLLHAVWAAGAAAMAFGHTSAPGHTPAPGRAPQGGRLHGALMLALLAGKLLVERRAAVSLFDSGLPVVTAAHLYGALAGLAGGAVAARALAPSGKPL